MLPKFSLSVDNLCTLLVGSETFFSVGYVSRSPFKFLLLLLTHSLCSY